MDKVLGSNLLTAPANRTLSDLVAEQLRQAILDGRLQPGQRVVEDDIARAMQMSRGPVRDALRMLENECLVVRFPHRGSFVAWLTLQDAEEIYSLREALETLAVDYTIRYATDAQIDELDQIVTQMLAQLKAGYTQLQATELDLEFHHALCRISGHSRVLTAWTALYGQVRLLLLTHRIYQPLDFRERGAAWHQDLVQALRKRDTALAHQVLHAHLTISYDSVAEAIRLGKAGSPPYEV